MLITKVVNLNVQFVKENFVEKETCRRIKKKVCCKCRYCHKRFPFPSELQNHSCPKKKHNWTRRKTIQTQWINCSNAFSANFWSSRCHSIQFQTSKKFENWKTKQKVSRAKQRAIPKPWLSTSNHLSWRLNLHWGNSCRSWNSSLWTPKLHNNQTPQIQKKTKSKKLKRLYKSKIQKSETFVKYWSSIRTKFRTCTGYS